MCLDRTCLDCQVRMGESGPYVPPNDLAKRVQKAADGAPNPGEHRVTVNGKPDLSSVTREELFAYARDKGWINYEAGVKAARKYLGSPAGLSPRIVGLAYAIIDDALGSGNEEGATGSMSEDIDPGEES